MRFFVLLALVVNFSSYGCRFTTTSVFLGGEIGMFSPFMSLLCKMNKMKSHMILRGAGESHGASEDSNQKFERRLRSLARMRAVDKIQNHVDQLQKGCEGNVLGSAADVESKRNMIENNSEDDCPENDVGLEDMEEPRSCDEALWEAAEEGDLEKLEASLERGANINGGDPFCDNYTALHFLSISDNAEGVDLLASRGADLAARSTHGETPLHVASAANATNAIRRLLHFGAPRKECDKWGKTPLDVARDGESTQAIELLRAPAGPVPDAT